MEYQTQHRSMTSKTPRMENNLHVHEDDAVSNPSTIRYRECQRNHGAQLGKTILDGCGEFMANGKQGTPESLRCAACHCHRSFHRKEIGGRLAKKVMATPEPALMFYPLGPLAIDDHVHQPPAAGGGTMLGFEGGSSGVHVNGGGRPRTKRVRTKFTQEQKEKMMEFSERIGWRTEKQDGDRVDEFCAKSGVKRRNFKIWMNNNKPKPPRENNPN